MNLNWSMVKRNKNKNNFKREGQGLRVWVEEWSLIVYSSPRQHNKRILLLEGWGWTCYEAKIIWIALVVWGPTIKSQIAVMILFISNLGTAIIIILFDYGGMKVTLQFCRVVMIINYFTFIVFHWPHQTSLRAVLMMNLKYSSFL